MAHHRRRRAKNRRAGCLLCKPWKMNGYAVTRAGGERWSDHRRRLTAERDCARDYGRSASRSFAAS